MARTAGLYFFRSQRSLTAQAAFLARRIARTWLDPYHPELHYMRGPGPKWCAKHGLPPNTTAADDFSQGILTGF